MKKLNLLSIAITTTIFCCKKEDVAQKSIWITENFKSKYTIQFPNNYEGTGMVGFEGNIFHKNRIDKKIEMGYFFWRHNWCRDFGAPLNSPFLDSINSEDKFGDSINLNLKTEFYSNGDKVGILYYDSKEISTGKYYMKKDSEYLKGLTIYFDHTEYQEIEDIINTITKK